MPNFLFDVKLFASIRVPAATAAEARAKLIAALDAADANLGSWPDGDPIFGECSIAGMHADDIEYLELAEEDEDA